MITKETCANIWNAWSEIERAKEMLNSLAETANTAPKREAKTLEDLTRRPQGLQLHIPNEYGTNSSFKVTGVSFEIGVDILEAHIKTQEAKLHTLERVARAEMYSNNLPPEPYKAAVDES